MGKLLTVLGFIVGILAFYYFLEYLGWLEFKANNPNKSYKDWHVIRQKDLDDEPLN